MASAAEHKRVTRREFFSSFIPSGGEWGVVPPIPLATENAVYYPFYNIHITPLSVKDAVTVPSPDLFFFELATPAWWVQQEKPKEVLKIEGGWIVPVWYYRMLTDELLTYLSQQDTYVAIEGITTPWETFSDMAIFGAAEIFVGAKGLVKFRIQYIQESEWLSDKYTRRKFITDLALSLPAGLWLTSRTSGGVMVFSETFTKIFPDLSSLNQVVRDVYRLQSHFHPEDAIVFCRNMLAARKLQFLAEQLPVLKSLGQKNIPHIPYHWGPGHVGIEDFLRLGPDWTLRLLGVYGRGFWQEMIQANGGIDTFCTTAVFPVAEIWQENLDTKHLLLDQQLKDRLTYLLSQPI